MRHCFVFGRAYSVFVGVVVGVEPFGLASFSNSSSCSACDLKHRFRLIINGFDLERATSNCVRFCNLAFSWKQTHKLYGGLHKCIVITTITGVRFDTKSISILIDFYSFHQVSIVAYCSSRSIFLFSGSLSLHHLQHFCIFVIAGSVHQLPKMRCCLALFSHFLTNHYNIISPKRVFSFHVSSFNCFDCNFNFAL